MSSAPQYEIFPLGDSAITVDFGNLIDEEINQRVLHLFEEIRSLSHPAILDVIPAYSSLTVHYDVAAFHDVDKTAFENVSKLIFSRISNHAVGTPGEKRLVEVPVCYSSKYAFDIEELSAQKKMSVDEVIQIHTAGTYRVYMIGFLPGFPYMGEVDDKISIPRREQPRTNVPAGSVGIAGKQTGIYPFTSPGGWQIIGRTPLNIFDKEKDVPVLFQPGDEVKFYPISEDEFADYQSRNY